MLSTIARLVTGSIFLLTLVACPGGSLTSVTITGGDRDLPQGTNLTLTADVETAGTAVLTVTWSSSHEDVATIDTDGNLTSHTPGTTIITATSNADPSKSDSIIVTVESADPTVTAVVINEDDQTLNVGDELLLTATVTTTGGASQDVTWTSSDDTIASADATGLVTANAEGTANITATSDVDGTISDTINITVAPPAILLRWTRQFGTSSHDFAAGNNTDASGNIYVAGLTQGALEGANAGGTDVFIRAYDANGKHRWTRQLGTSNSERARAIATDTNGNVYAAGYTDGDRECTNSGGRDTFIRTYAP